MGGKRYFLCSAANTGDAIAVSIHTTSAGQVCPLRLTGRETAPTSLKPRVAMSA
jgi:hypothetical protein